jgi:TM2 domain-containing membrane protein YozV
MNGMNDATQPDWNTNPQKPVAFCQNCGKSLDSQTVRKVGPAVYCEPCLAARLAGAPPNPAGQPPRPGYGPDYGPVFVGGSVNGQPIASSAPNPGLAALLGLIPGVGAMYNEQYAKGIAHLLIFAILVMFSHISGFFVLFVLGWICYMAMEAHHTAKARRDGTPLPNPFGLNDIGERMGFGRSWPSGAPDFAAAARDAAEAAAAGVGAAAAGFGRTTPPVTPPPTSSTGSAPWGAPSDAYHAAPGYTAPYTAQPYTPVPPYAPPYVPPYTPPVPPVPPYTPPPYSAPFTPVPPAAVAANRFPAGAVWLIGLGMFFLLSTMGVFHAVPRTALLGVVLLALGAWAFLRRMTCTGQPLAYDGTAAYNLRVLRALRGSVWLIVFGILALLDSFHLASWSDSWPWIIIVVGVMMLLERTVAHSAAAAAPTPAPAYVEGWDDPPAPPSHPTDSRPDTRADSSAGSR